MKRIAIILSGLLACVANVSAQSVQNNLLFNMTDDAATSTMSAVTVSDSLFTIVGTNGVTGNIMELLPGFVNGCIRGTDSYSSHYYLTIVDGIERDASYLRPEEVESVTVLKDAASLAAFGLRGANGALVIKTKRGGEGPVRITADYHAGFNTKFREPEMASDAEYCLAINEALRNDGLASRYSLSDINALADGTSVFPHNDWRSLLSRNFSHEHKLTFTADGTEKGVRFFVMANYTGGVGRFNNTELNDGYTTQSLSSTLDIRSNFEVMLTRTTQLAAHLNVYLRQDQNPSDNYSAYFNTPSFLFPLTTGSGEWIVAPNYGNPYRNQCGGGYTTSINRNFTADITLNQDLSMVTKGLKASLLLSYDACGGVYDSHGIGSSYNVIFWDLSPDKITESYTLTHYGNDTGNGYSGGNVSAFSDRYSGWLKLDYARVFDKHDVSASALFDMSHYKAIGGGSVSAYMDGVLHAHYGYDRRYIVDFTAALSNSGKLHKVFFTPAVSAAWVLSNERFLKDASWLNQLKIKASWGRTAFDGNLGYDMDKRYNNLNNGSSYIFKLRDIVSGSAEGSLPTVGVVPEIDTKANLGVDFTVLGGLTLSAEVFRNKRENLQGGASAEYSSVLGVGYPTIFTGKSSNWGVDLSLGYTGKTGDWKYNAYLAATYSKGRVDYYPEGYVEKDWQKYTGVTFGTMNILQSDGFYTPEDFDADGNLREGVVKPYVVSSVQPGDVKYKDLDGDGDIDSYDFAYVEKYNTTPKWVYNLNLGFEYKHFGLQAIFRAKTDFYVYTNLASVYQPLVGDNRYISKYYLQNYWYEGNEANAKYPRLTTKSNDNNFASSDVWISRGDFFKLQTLYAYYDFGENWHGALKALRVFFRGHNLFSIDGIKIFDPENISGGYPSTRKFEFGAKLTF